MRLGSESRNAYKQNETGRIDPSLGKLSQLVQAVNLLKFCVLAQSRVLFKMNFSIVCYTSLH